MDADNIIISSRDGAEITACLYRASQNTSEVVFICLPAMGVKASYYKLLAKTLSAAGHDVILCDIRGQGTSNRKAPAAKFGYHALLELDLPAYVKAARHAFQNKKRVFLGHSLGGHLSLLHAATRPDSVDAVAIIASGSVYYKAYPFVQSLKIWIGTQSSILVSSLLGYFPGDKIGFGGKQPKQIMRDWARQGRTGRFTPKGSDLDYEAAMAVLEKPVFACSIEGDDLAPHAATDHLLSKLEKAKVTRIRYKPSEALTSKIDHFRWVKHSDDIVASLTEWVDNLAFE